MNMDKVRESSKKFMEKEYPDEVPYFDIAWEVFEKQLEDQKNKPLNRQILLSGWEELILS